MRLLIDAHLPRRMVGWLAANGHDAIHTQDLPGRNLTSDVEVMEIADREGRIVVTKDADFVNSHILRGRPAKLLLIKLGNIVNRDLEAIVRPLLSQIDAKFQFHDFLEINATGLVVHSAKGKRQTPQPDSDIRQYRVHVSNLPASSSPGSREVTFLRVGSNAKGVSLEHVAYEDLPIIKHSLTGTLWRRAALIIDLRKDPVDDEMVIAITRDVILPFKASDLQSGEEEGPFDVTYM